MVDDADRETVLGKINLVDLAGSERLKKSESDGQRLKEALHINSSLSAIGKVVMSLDPGSGSAYIPYRDSKLTRIFLVPQPLKVPNSSHSLFSLLELSFLP